MKVVFLSHYTSLYGANLAMLNLANDLKERYGYQIMIIFPHNGDAVKKARSMGIETFCCRYIPWRANSFFFVRGMCRIVLNSWCSFIIEKRVLGFKPDIIHSNSSVVDLGVVLAKKLKTPCVWHLREFGEEDYNLKYIVPQKHIVERYSQAACLVAVSDAIRRKYLESFPSLQIEKVYDGIQDLCVIKEKHDGVNFCCIGTLKESKGQIDVLNAVVQLVKDHYTDFKVYFLGDGKTAYVKKLKKFVDEHGINNNVIMNGYVSSVDKMLGIMDVGIMASKKEAFGRVTVEYMLAKMGVIATRSGGTVEILGEDAKYYESGDYLGLAELMKRYILNKNDLLDDGEKLFKIADVNFRQCKNTDNVHEIYTHLISNKGINK